MNETNGQTTADTRERILSSATARRMKDVMNSLVNDLLLHDGWGHLDMDMKIMSRNQKEIIIRCGREFRFVLDFKNGPSI